MLQRTKTYGFYFGFYLGKLCVTHRGIGMGCKAVFAANIKNICKRTNAADRPSPAYHEP
jgi:hypothetical protein